jgi:hypothetical protein
MADAPWLERLQKQAFRARELIEAEEIKHLWKVRYNVTFLGNV